MPLAAKPAVVVIAEGMVRPAEVSEGLAQVAATVVESLVDAAVEVAEAQSRRTCDHTHPQQA